MRSYDNESHCESDVRLAGRAGQNLTHCELLIMSRGPAFPHVFRALAPFWPLIKSNLRILSPYKFLPHHSDDVHLTPESAIETMCSSHSSSSSPSAFVSGYNDQTRIMVFLEFPHASLVAPFSYVLVHLSLKFFRPRD